MPSTILRPIFLTVRNRLNPTRTRPENRKRDLLLLAFALGTMICIFFCCSMIFSAASSDNFFREILPTKLIELTFFSFFFLLLFSNTIAAIGNLYTAPNMNLLLAAPVSSGRLYLAKLLETVIETGTMYFIFLFPVALAYCVFLGVESWFLVAAGVVSIPFLFIPAGLGMALGTLVVRIAALFRKKALFVSLLGLTALAAAAAKAIQTISRYETEYQGAAALVELVGLFSNPSPVWLPSRWAADLLSAYAAESGGGSYQTYMLLTCSAIGAAGLGFLVFDYFFFRIWSNADNQDKEQPVAAGHGLSLLDGLRVLPLEAHTRAIVTKDIRHLLRDRAQAIQLLMYIVIAGFHVTSFRFMGRSMSMSSVAGDLWQSTIASLNFLFAGFILISMMTRLVYPSISLEGRAFWILLVAPLDIKRLISVKFWSWLPVTLLSSLALLLSGALALGASTQTIIYTVVGSVFLSVGCTGLAIGLGAVFASFEWEAPNQISSGLGTMVLLLYGLVVVVLTALPVATLLFLGRIPELREYIGTPLAYGLIFGACLMLVIVNLRVARIACERGVAALTIRTT